MIDRLNRLIERAGLKHWVFALRRDHEFLAWINAQTTDMPAETPFPIRVYSAVHAERPVCPNGGQRTLKSIVGGWKFCGKTGKCACARESVAASVRRAKALETLQDKEASQRLREQTNLERYGHINTGQTDLARSAHAEFYGEQDNVNYRDPEEVAASKPNP